jgi:hypothetical protein
VVDLTHYFPKDAKDPDGRAMKVWETWQRAAMGLRLSPYQVVQAMGMVEEVIHVIRGDWKDPNNVFCWDRVMLNLLGSEAYDPNKPWVYKLRLDDGQLQPTCLSLTMTCVPLDLVGRRLGQQLDGQLAS